MSSRCFHFQKPEYRIKWPNNELIGPNLNKPIFSLFPKKRTLVGLFHCPECTKIIKPIDFRDEISKKEYSITGQCQFCQDSMFDTCT